ncbi:triose-phosphate isomerase [Hazenella sp. IB182357]|uniref:Triosephosphate isomerase n=1 Tax=Polycladospora coralii TaxID=2771432 RepID=A0A926RT20_9BACL|nr:triose-phosphate isomerase [Polycladospora coralii]MBD1372255.1 triose-phosphate isomerase [Polycladospora coralii]MBS7530754.1 triose-phosphate isomerase [Polycladospora coralii]
MRKQIIAGNWKMYKTATDARRFMQAINQTDWASELDIVICAPSITIPALIEELKGTERGIAIGAQNVHWEEEGAFTGEISVSMVKEVGARYVIIGHSERRTLFGETDEMVNKKVKRVLEAGLIPIVCVGESQTEREQGRTNEVVGMQVEAAFQGIEKKDMTKVIVAYEPVWAIGTGLASTPTDAEMVIAEIRRQISHLYDVETAESVRLQYGGSVKPNNIKSFLASPNIDGALVGGASLAADSFSQMIGAMEVSS